MMLAISGSLFAWAWAAFLLAPALVTRRSWAIRHPAAALSTWAGLFVTGAVGAVPGLALTLRSARELSADTVSGSGDPLSTCDSCHAAAVFGASWLMTALVGGGVCVAAYRAVEAVVRRRQTGRLARRACTALPRDLIGGVPVAVLASEQLLAACAPGRHAHVVVSSALRDLLSPPELAAVVAHESAHLGRWHRLLLALAGLQQACLHGVARAGETHRSVGLLVELAADDRAARRCGRTTTATALRKVADASGDEAMRLRARRTALAATGG